MTNKGWDIYAKILKHGQPSQSQSSRPRMGKKFSWILNFIFVVIPHSPFSAEEKGLRHSLIVSKYVSKNPRIHHKYIFLFFLYLLLVMSWSRMLENVSTEMLYVCT